MKRMFVALAAIAIVATAQAQTFLGYGVWESPDQIKCTTNSIGTNLTTSITNRDTTAVMIPVISLVRGSPFNIGGTTNICPTNVITAAFTPAGGSKFGIGTWTSQVVSNETLQALTLYPPIRAGDALTLTDSWAGSTNGTQVLTWYFMVPVNR